MTATPITGNHPYADAWPMLSDDELAELAEDIKINGLREPVVIYNDLILDGRNRFAACKLAKIEPIPATQFDGDDDAALAFVQSVNNGRRHQSKGSLAASWALSMLAAGKRSGGQWKYGESRNSEIRADVRAVLGTIADHAPELLTQVRDDVLSLNAAHGQAEDARDADRLRLEEEQRIEAEEADALAQLPDEYKSQIGDKFSSARVAFTAWEDANRAEAARRRQEKDAAQRKAAAERKARIDLHTQVLTVASSAATFGGYDDMTVLLDGYKASDMPKHLVRETTSENLIAARRFIDYLIEWQGAGK